jgi:hypothetical protein
MKNLSAASDVVCLLTHRSIERPWILYEAGVAKGKLNTPVYGIALGITLSRAASGPFAQFQNSDDSEESLTKLVMQLVGRIPNSEPDRDAIAMQVRTFNEKAKNLLEALDVEVHIDAQPSVDDTTVAKLFEEVKVMFQDLPSRIEGPLIQGVIAGIEGSIRRCSKNFGAFQSTRRTGRLAAFDKFVSGRSTLAI